MAKMLVVLAASLLVLVVPVPQQDLPMSFFLTSVGVGNGADLGGLTGADRHCQQLAEAVGAGDREWRAYLSTIAADGQPAVHARDRVGSGPWYNAKGVMVAATVAELHSDSNKLSKEHSLNENGEPVKGRGSPTCTTF